MDYSTSQSFSHSGYVFTAGTLPRHPSPAHVLRVRDSVCDRLEVGQRSIWDSASAANLLIRAGGWMHAGAGMSCFLPPTPSTVSWIYVATQRGLKDMHVVLLDSPWVPNPTTCSDIQGVYKVDLQICTLWYINICPSQPNNLLPPGFLPASSPLE